MKRTKWTVGMVVLWAFCSLTFAGVVTIVADPWEPYNASADADLPGYGIEIAQAVFQKAGYTVEYINYPWSRAIIEVRRGRYSAVIGAFESDTPDFIFPDEEFGIARNAFFVKEGNPWQFDGIDSLEGLVLGVIRDYSYGDEMDEYIEMHHQDRDRVQVFAGEDALERMIQMLMADRISVFIEDLSVLQFLLAGSDETIVEAGFVGEEKVYVAFSPALAESAKLAEIFSEGIRGLRESGELKEILNKYGLTDWK